MRIILAAAAASLASLAACGGGASNNSANDAAANTGANAAAPARAPAAAPAAPADPATAADLASIRGQIMQECTRGMAREASAAATVQRICTCASDRLMAGKTAAELIAERGSGRGPAILQQCILDAGGAGGGAGNTAG